MDFFRSPAVSMKVKVPCGFSMVISTASRVVPAMSETMHRFSPATRFTKEDLPTLGLPMTATLMTSPSGSSSSPWGRLSSTRSSRSPVPWPWTEDTITGSPRPRL